MYKSIKSNKLILVVLAMALVTMLAVMPAFGSVTAINVDGPMGPQPIGSDATFTATATNPGGTSLYQFWVHDSNGWDVVQDYSTTNTYTMSSLNQGSYVFAVYALDQADRDAGNWGLAKYQSFVVNIGSSVSLNAAYANNEITLNGSAAYITNPVYQFWYEKPDGTWVGTDYSDNAAYTFTPDQEGTYNTIAYAKDLYAPNDYTHSVWSDVKSVTVKKALEVVEVSAINRTTVEATLNEEADAEAAADVASYIVTVGDTAVEVKSVAYDEDTNIATLTVADMKNLVGVVAVNGVEGAAVDYIVEAAVIKGEASAAEVPVGRDVDVTFVVEDKDGDLMQGAEVRVRVLSGPTLVKDFGVLVTDEKGEVTVTYGSEVLDAGGLDINAVVVSKPVIKTEVPVNWTDVRDDLIVIDELGKATLPTTDVGDDENVRTYTVTFNDAYGNPLAAGEEVFVEVEGMDADGTTAIDASNICTYIVLAKSGKLTSAYSSVPANVFGYKLATADNGKVTFNL
ncbi:MAG: hypothetical protein PHP51_00105, partial [Desulfotomaculaceae bacterium]|nr:hypothetical protein [Desulfotomaculaceae bacterium]